MRNRILTLLFLFPSIFFTPANSIADNGISRDDAVKRVKELLQKDNEQSYKYYTSKTILKDTVYTARTCKANTGWFSLTKCRVLTGSTHVNMYS